MADMADTEQELRTCVALLCCELKQAPRLCCIFWAASQKHPTENKLRLGVALRCCALKRLHRSCIYWATLLTLLDYGLAQNAQGVHKFVAISVRA